MIVDALLSRLDGVQSRGRGRWTAKCPAHDDRSPSLSIAETPDGVVLLHCFGGCDPDAVVGAVGLELHSLFPPRAPDPEGRRSPRPTFDPVGVIHALAHELRVVAFLASDLAEQVDPVTRQRLIKASDRIHRALHAVEAPRKA